MITFIENSNLFYYILVNLNKAISGLPHGPYTVKNEDQLFEFI